MCGAMQTVEEHTDTETRIIITIIINSRSVTADTQGQHRGTSKPFHNPQKGASRKLSSSNDLEVQQ